MNVMDKKIKFNILLLIFMMFTLFHATPKSFAYWAKDITIMNTPQSIIGDVTIGYWDQLFEWQSDIIYVKGDVVTYNGDRFEAKRQNQNKPPRGPNNWRSYWREL